MGRRRRRRRDAVAVSLFPFLSVLACVIGTLTLLLAVTAVQRIGGPSLASVRLAEQLAALEARIRGGEARLEMLDAQLRESEQRARDEKQMGRRLAALGLSLDVPLEELRALSELARRSVELEERERALERKRQTLTERTVATEAELADRRAAQARMPIIIDPTGLGRDWRPYLVECTSDYIELHRTSGDFSVRIPRAEIQTSEDYGRYLRRVRAIRDAIVIFMIRPDGVATYETASREADQYQVRHAKLPLPGEGQLDFSRLAGGS